jgi:glycosyltransferase involved in cell wall biosynthesis
LQQSYFINDRENYQGLALERQKILYLCGYHPLPVVAGIRHRIYNIGRLLQNLGDVTLGVVSLYKSKDYDAEGIKQNFGDFINIYASERPENSVFKKLRLLYDKKWIKGRDYLISKKNGSLLTDAINEHDLIWIHTLEVADRTGIYRWPKSILDLDDLNHIKLLLSAKLQNGAKNKAADYWRSFLWMRWEKDVLNRFDVVTVCSEEDRQLLGGDRRIHTVPNGFDVAEEKPEIKPRNQKLIGFVGTLKYYANHDGLLWFLEKVLPKVLSKVPGARLRVVGLLPRDNKKLVHPNVDLLGFVENYSTEMDKWAAIIVPIRIGGGTRIKILDAFSKMCPVVSTKIGAYGLNVEDGRQLLIRDTPEAFAGACIKLMSEPKIAQSLVEQGWDTVSSRFNWKKNIKINLENAVRHCVDINKDNAIIDN